MGVDSPFTPDVPVGYAGRDGTRKDPARGEKENR